MKNLALLTTILLLSFGQVAQAQFGIGLTTGGDFYQRYTNPESTTDPSDASTRSAGSALLNTSLGPKIWIGGNNFSLSVESHVVFAALALDVNEYKGLGAVAFPVMAHLNFRGLSGFGNAVGFRTGFAIGGGIQYNRTELFGLTRDFDNLNRSLFPTYVGEIQFGGGGAGMSVYGYVRYGMGYDFDTQDFDGANSLNIGTTLAINITQLKKRNPFDGGGSDDADDEDENVGRGRIRQ